MGSIHRSAPLRMAHISLGAAPTVLRVCGTHTATRFLINRERPVPFCISKFRANTHEFGPFTQPLDSALIMCYMRCPSHTLAGSYNITTKLISSPAKNNLISMKHTYMRVLYSYCMFNDLC